MTFESNPRRASRFGALAKVLPVLALAAGFGVLAPGMALAQHHGGGGGGGHAGGGGNQGGGNQGGGGWHGGGHGGGGQNGGWHGGSNGGWHGSGWHGGYGWHGNGWGSGYGWRGGWGWGPGWGWGAGLGLGLGLGGYYPGYAVPYWDDGVYSPLVSAPVYAEPDGDQDAYGPPGQGAYGPPGQQDYAPADGLVDNSRGFYRWQVGVENGSCNRPYLAQVVNSVTGATPASLRPGERLGGIDIAPVIGGRIGPRLDVTDQACATEALERTNTGTPVRWQTANGIPVTFTITRTTESAGRRCRDFEATATFASQPQTAKGSACKETDGSWRSAR